MKRERQMMKEMSPPVLLVIIMENYSKTFERQIHPKIFNPICHYVGHQRKFHFCKTNTVRDSIFRGRQNQFEGKKMCTNTDVCASASIGKVF